MGTTASESSGIWKVCGAEDDAEGWGGSHGVHWDEEEDVGMVCLTSVRLSLPLG